MSSIGSGHTRRALIGVLSLGLLACGDAVSSSGTKTSDAAVTLADRGAAPSGDAALAADAVPFLDVRLQLDAGSNDAGGGGADGTGGPRDGGGGAADATADLGGDDCGADLDCDDGFFCNGVERCLRGACFADPRLPCADAFACTANLCDEEANACDVVPDDTLCAEGQVCDPKVGCFLPIGCTEDAECDDGEPCNGVEACVERTCRPGTPVHCDDAVSCTIDTCNDETGACGSVPDHGACLPGELCSLRAGCEPRPPCVRDDDCDDGIFCNGQETCDLESGLCRGGAAPAVDDAVDCTQDVCSEASGTVTHTPRNNRCQDGVFCNGPEVCHPQRGCQPGAPPVVNDGVRCTADACDEDADFITHTPQDAPCDDGLFCNGIEVCDVVADCTSGDPPVQNDGIGCTIDACSEVEQRVVHRPDDERCDDSVFCNGPEVCDPDRGCLAGVGLSLDDGLDCTDDDCLEDRREVRHSPVDARCDNGLFCDGTELCIPEMGCTDGADPNRDDSVDCTRDTCDEATNTLVHTPDDAECDNGVACDGAEVCDAITDCQPGRNVALDDRIDCTDDVCDPITGMISHRPNDALCDNGLFCDGTETCDGFRGCVVGRSPLADDGINCTNAICDEDTDRIRQEPVHARCDDALFCNGAELCEPLQGCRPGTPPLLTDNVGCTVDDCDEANDRVLHTPNNAGCNDNVFCNGTETCDAVRDCQPGPPPITNDGVNCTNDSCDEANDRVVHAADNARCVDANVCNGAETCDVIRGCLPGANAAAGTVCQPNPRNICLAGACNATRCGDGFTDAGAVPVEQCDGGANCNNLCQLNGAGPNYTGNYGLVPALIYACQDAFFGADVVNINTALLAFSVAGAQLRVSGLEPGVLVQSPVPAGADFSVRLVLAGGCQETYVITGTFSDATHWCGTFTATYSGAQCGLTNCSNQSIPVCGTRQ